MAPILPMDLHTHTIASGHGTNHTMSQIVKASYYKGIQTLGFSDHGPATPGSCKESYFRSLKIAPKEYQGMGILYGAEVNILNESGELDLSDDILKDLDFVIASIHEPTYTRSHSISTSSPETLAQEYTNAYKNAMRNPYVTIIGHPDDVHFPIDISSFVYASMEQHVIIEVNEASLSPNGYRGYTRPIMSAMLEICMQEKYPILLSSDSHGAECVGEAPLGLQLIQEMGFSENLIWNYQPHSQLFAFRS